MIDHFAPTGGGDTSGRHKDKPGPLYGVSSHAWSALAVAMTASFHLGLEKAA